MKVFVFALFVIGAVYAEPSITKFLSCMQSNYDELLTNIRFIDQISECLGGQEQFADQLQELDDLRAIVDLVLKNHDEIKQCQNDDCKGPKLSENTLLVQFVKSETLRLNATVTGIDNSEEMATCMNVPVDRTICRIDKAFDVSGCFY